MRHFKHTYFIFLFLLILTGCKDYNSKKNFNEGIIEYSILFEENTQSHINTSLLPNKLTIKFHDNNTSNTIEGLSGAFNLTYINNVKDENAIILVKLLNKKFYCEEPFVNGILPSTYAGMPKVTIQETNDIINFRGYKCKKAIGSFIDDSDVSFEILYTNEIKITNPNSNTPFEAVNGVMLKFKVKFYKHMMSVSATTIKPERISMDNFTTPSDYAKVSKKTIADLLSLLQ